MSNGDMLALLMLFFIVAFLGCLAAVFLHEWIRSMGAEEEGVEYLISPSRHPRLTQRIEGEISPTQRKWNDLLQEARDNPDKGPEEEPWGVTEFTPVAPTPFEPTAYLDPVSCTSCSRHPLPGEDIYEVPMGDGSVKVLCALCGKVPS